MGSSRPAVAAGNRLAKIDPTSGTTLYTLGLADRLSTYGRAASMMPPQSGDDGRAASPLAAVGSYAYDTAGNVTHIVRENGTTLDLTWDSQYQLVAVSTNGVFAESYSYDALGRRVSTTTLDGTIRHIYDDSWQCIADVDEQGNVVASYVWGEGIDNLLAVNIGYASYYPITDIQGTVWGYVDSANNVVALFDYDAWGNILSAISTVPALVTNRYRFQGREWSAVTGLTNFRMRWYDAETGRWVSKDPIGLSGGLNLYVFCGNDAIGFCDFVGLSKGKGSEDDDDLPPRRPYIDRYVDIVDDLIVDPRKLLQLAPIGVMPKRWVSHTGGRPPGLGSKNPWTSIPRGMGIGNGKAHNVLRSKGFRGASFVSGAVFLGAGVWNVGVMVGATIGALYFD